MVEILIFHEKSNPLMPWTLRIHEGERGWAHYPCAHVRLLVPSETVEDYNAQSSQKFYVKAKGYLSWDEGRVAVIAPTPGAGSA